MACITSLSWLCLTETRWSATNSRRLTKFPALTSFQFKQD